MTDDFDTRVETWLRDRARPDPTSLEAVRTSIDALPPRRRSPQRSLFAAAAAVIAVVAIGVSALFISTQPNGTAPTPPSRPVPPDPAAFAGDPRLNACYGAAGPVEFVFEMPHARDYQHHFPAMLLAPELDVDDPALAVVFASDSPALIGGSRPPSAIRDPTPTNPNERWVCILVGGTPNVYENVDISGMQVDLGDGPLASTSESPTSSPASPSSTPTLTPAPPPSEAVEAPWRDSDLVASTSVRTIVGPGHCGWESTVWMFIDDKELYLRDPDGIFADVEVGAFLPDTTLPSDAHDTGLSSNGRRLFTVPSGDAVYVRTSTGVERWPRSTDPFMGCA
jgi:hypothetical protein